MSLTSFIITLCSFLRIIWAFRENDTNICPSLEEIDGGIFNIIRLNSILGDESAIIGCKEGYDLDGSSEIHCVDGKWEPKPKCSRRCPPPPRIRNGRYDIDGEKDLSETYRKGSLVTYLCRNGFYLSPQDGKYRICVKGNWTGSDPTCVAGVVSCPPPKDIPNGYFVHEKTGIFDGYNVGQRLHYSCKREYSLKGSPVQQCLEDGTWSPKLQPTCNPNESVFTSSENSDPDVPCKYPPPHVPHTFVSVSQGFQSSGYAMSGTIVKIQCISKYKNTKNPCQPERLRCVEGRWVGPLPNCVLARDCDAPPSVLYATTYNLNPAAFPSTLPNKYPIKSQISYQCLPGYMLEGNDVLECSNSGCWIPSEAPTCYRASIEFNSFNLLLISAASGVVVSALFLVLITLCRKRKSLSRAVPLPPPSVQGPGLGDHATLLHHPDRLALIAFADGIHDQSQLPTYEEAIRDRNPGLTVNRLQRPHWPNLACRRARNTPNPDMVHVTRHGSFASHTPSTRSAAGDSMGSTDTMAISEGSTNVTLDTASSHSGSQPASCRVHCGSLASFDTCSVINNEGVPLLEESELEEIQVSDTVSLVVDTHSTSDNASIKLSVASADTS